MKAPRFDRPGSWQALLESALPLIDDLATRVYKPSWSFGGGTVLMLRLNHRHSKDIDLFVPDPQYLGFVTPRLSDAAERLTAEYPRDPFDLCAVAELEPAAIPIAKPFMERHARAFLAGLHDRRDLTKADFDQIERIAFDRTFDECLVLAERILA